MTKENNYQFWERGIVLELSREHEHACRTHGIRLPPIGILLFDSETRWGEYDHLTRTISISRKLVREFAWHQVLGVFRHEMAHQLVAESEPYDSAAPHGEKFKEACRRLGVPDQFAKAGLDLRGSDFDWRTEKRNEATERILEKVRKLLALAGSSNEHEALLAMDRVRELYAKYNLANAKAEEGSSYVHLVISHGKKRAQAWQLRTISILVEHFFVKALTFSQFDANTCERHFAVELIGARENVLMGEYVYFFLQNHLEILVKKAAKTRGGDFGRTERSSYRLGVLDGFSAKLSRSETEVADERASRGEPARAGQTSAERGLTPIGRALANFKKDDRLDNYLSAIYPRLRNRKQTSLRVDYSAFRAGHQAGREMNLNQPLTSQMGNLGKRLS